jgi:tetratricopeptide (TPR) repeat protein
MDKQAARTKNSSENYLKNYQYSRIIYVTITLVTILIVGCRTAKYDGHPDYSSQDYRGQTPIPTFAQEYITPAAISHNTSTQNNHTPSIIQNQKTIPPNTPPQFVDVPFTDPFGASSSILPEQNQTPNYSTLPISPAHPNSSTLPNSLASPNSPTSPASPASTNLLSGNHSPNHSFIAENKNDHVNINSPTNQIDPPTAKSFYETHQNIRNENSFVPFDAVPPSPFPIEGTQNNLAADNNGIWGGDTNLKTQSINEASKNENENIEKNKLFEIAKTKRQQDIDPKKKYLQPFSDRLGPFAGNEKRDVIDNDISIISPVTYLEENPKIFDNKPIYDWEKEEHTAFDWSTLDPVITITKIKDQLGFGINEEKAKKHFQVGHDFMSKARVTKALSEGEKLNREAGKYFIKAAKRFPNSLLEEDALNWAGESYFFGGDYTRSFNAYQKLMVKYKHSKYLDLTAKRLFAMARYWEACDRKRNILLVNFTEKSLPYFDTFGYAGKAYETIFINDPNNPLADDAVMAIASAHLARGKYEGDTSYERAAFYYKYLTENYPLSEHFDNARKGELLARSEAYMGPEYNHKTLDTAKELAEMINRSRTPNQTDENENEDDALTELNENIITKNAEREWVLGKYYDTKRYYGSARLFYQNLIEKYPQTTYAEQARKRLEQIKNKPDKPSNFGILQRNKKK